MSGCLPAMLGLGSANQQTGNSDSDPDSDNLWASLLKEVAANKGSTLPRKSLLVLGDRDSGKTTLLAKLQGNEDPKKGSGLEFGYIDVSEEDEESEDLTLLNFWVLDGDMSHTNLLKFSLTEKSVVDTTVVICVSMATPWSILDQLETWMKVLQDHVDSLKLSGEEVSQLREAKLKRWENYVEPGLDFVPGKFGSTSGPASLGSPTLLTSAPFPLSDDSPTEEKDSWDGVLTRNLGLDVVIVLTKTDSMTKLESEHGLTDQHFDFIQHAVRRFCLQYGASLFYTSVKEDKNCDLLYKYLVHQNYDLVPFTTPALVVERDALFIPSGWDSSNKVSILHENLFNLSPHQPYSQVIKSPFIKHSQNRQHNGKNIEILAEREQDFLSRIAPFLMADNLQSQADISKALVAGSRIGPAESVLKTPERRVVGSPGVHSALKRSEYGSSSSGGKIPVNDGAISNFFHALLNKKSGSALNAGSTVLPSKGHENIDNDINKLNGNADVPGQTVLPKSNDPKSDELNNLENQVRS